MPGRCREGVWASQNIEVSISADTKTREVHWIAECVIMGEETQPLFVLPCCLMFIAAGNFMSEITNDQSLDINSTGAGGCDSCDWDW